MEYNNKIFRISEEINILFRKLFISEKHPFYNDLNRVKEIHKKYEIIKKKSKLKLKYDPFITIPNELKINNNYNNTVLDLDVLKLLSIEMSKSSNIDKIQDLVNQLYYMNIPSNINNLEKTLSIYKNSNRINIAIIGAGPIGLVLACYIYKYYNLSYGLNNYPKVNIMVFDNRIVKDGMKKPYNRYRPFAFDSSFFSFLIPKIYTWDKNNKNSLLINIYLLEYVLFTLAYYVYNIPFVFEESSWDRYCKIMKNGKFDVMFDCTGGRLNPPIFKSVDSTWLNKFSENTTDYPNLNIDVESNLVTLNIPKIDKLNFIENYYYSSLIIFNEEDNNKQTFLIKFDIDIKNYDDLKLFLKLKDKYFYKRDILTICKKIKDTVVRNYTFNNVKNYNNMSKNNNLLYKFDLFNTYLKHSISISKYVNNNNYNFLYIGAGDTIFHSHFITGAGLNRTINFAIKCANFITNLSLVKE